MLLNDRPKIITTTKLNVQLDTTKGLASERNSRRDPVDTGAESVCWRPL